MGLLPLIAPFVGAALVGGYQVPSPGLAVMSSMSPSSVTLRLLAQGAGEEEPDAAREAEEENLEADMARAREHLGHKEEAAPEPAAVVEGEGQELDEEPPRRRRRRRSRRYPPGYEPPTLDGHGRAYYLVWGIVDWSVAGGMWLGSLYSFAVSAALLSVGYQDGRLDDDLANPKNSDRRLYKRDYRAAGWIMAGVGALLAGSGGFMAWRAGLNITDFRHLRAQQNAELKDWRKNQRRERYD